MNILAPYAYFAPEQAASSYLWKNLHEDFAKDGMYCYVYTPMPCRGISEKVRKEYKEKKVMVLYDGKLTIRRFRLWDEPNSTLWRFVRYFAQCGWQYFNLAFAKTRSWDVIFAASTPPIIGATCALIKKRQHIPFVYNLQDIFPDSLLGTNITQSKGILWKIGRKLENFTYLNADKIIVISEDFKKNIMLKGVPEEKIVVAYNWVDQNAVVNINRKDNKLIKRYGLDPDKFYVTYCGNIGLTQNMELLIEIAESLADRTDIQFVLVGEGAYLEQLKKAIAERSIMNITLLPFQPYEDISHVFSLGDVGIIISKPGVGSNSVPSKTWSIMSASRPVLANFDENEIKNILTDNNCGIFTMAGDKKAFKNAILKFYENIEEAIEMGKNGRKFIMDNLTREVGTQKYIDVLKSVVK